MISRTRSHAPARTRAAFTLPELLVVVTITLILMSILVQASTIITSTVSSAKAQGDFVGQERMALAVMRRDLQFDHFIEEDGNPSPTRGRKLSDQRTDRAYASNGQIQGYKTPQSGYFWAGAKVVDNTVNFDEGADSDGFSSTRSGNHFMQFTIVTPGGSPEQTLTADIPVGNPNVTTGTCGEVAYFLVSNGQTPNGTLQFKLVRRQRLAARNNDDDPAYGQLLNQSGAQPTDPPEVVACNLTNGRFDMLNLNELTFRSNRVAQQPITTHRVGEDVLHHHVTSFELKFTGSGPGWPRTADINGDYPYDTLPYDGEYDTGDATQLSSANNLADG
ncbi:MAG TPA: prepilin-type N-terminal cleavage/methylation domain-containing protein, partial [Gemmata sp.]